MKPVMYVANVEEDGFENNALLEEVKAVGVEEKLLWSQYVPRLRQRSLIFRTKKTNFLEDIGMHEPGLNRVIRAAYQLLGLETYFTAGVKEVRAWTIHKGDLAPQAAGVIHTDFERGFIRAQTISYEDFVQYKGEAGAKEAGKLRVEGKDYVVQDGDIMNFLFNV